MNKKKIKQILIYLTVLFLLVVSFFVIPFPDSIRRLLFLPVAFVALCFLVFGVILIFISKNEHGKLKFFLILTGISATLPLVFSILHNFFYALSIIYPKLKILLEVLHAGSFIISLLVSPILFLIGLVGSFIYVKSKKS